MYMCILHFATAVRADWHCCCCRQEACGELLALREQDAPGTTDSREVKDRKAKGLPDFPEGTVQVQGLAFASNESPGWFTGAQQYCIENQQQLRRVGDAFGGV